MDKRTRVFNAMDKKPVDHVPVGFWYHFEGEQARGEAIPFRRRSGQLPTGKN